MLIGTFPFKAKTEEFLAKKINKGEFDLPNFISVDAKNLIKKILVFEPKNRLSTEEILKDKWFEF
jgi:serine/threonine protein kinase